MRLRLGHLLPFAGWGGSVDPAARRSPASAPSVPPCGTADAPVPVDRPALPAQQHPDAMVPHRLGAILANRCQWCAKIPLSAPEWRT